MLLLLGVLWACDEATRPVDGPAQNRSGNQSGEAPQANALNMELVGRHTLQGRSSYQPVIREWRGQWLLFAGHHAGKAENPLTGGTEANGLSILDVTDPAVPELIHHLPASGDGISGTQHVQLCRGSELPRGDSDRLYLLRTNGQVSHEIWDVSEPRAPVFVKTVAETGRTLGGQQNTHKNWWDCATGIGYLLSTVDGWRVPRVLQAFDLSDPENPLFIRNFALNGMQPGTGEEDLPDVGVHQPVVYGNRIYLGYGSGHHGVTQILDRDKFLKGDPESADPFAPTPANLAYPEIARLDMPTYWGSHTAKPVYEMAIDGLADNRDGAVRDILIVVSESMRPRCQETRHAVFFLDITEEDKPYPVANYQVPESEGHYCQKGGRFGPHAPHDSFQPDFWKKLVLVSYFNAGVRAVDIRDPFNPVEIGYYIPRPNENSQPRCVEIEGKEVCDTAIQTNNVNVDDRGYIYTLDRAGAGLHILKLTGPAHELVGLPVQQADRRK